MPSASTRRSRFSAFVPLVAGGSGLLVLLAIALLRVFVIEAFIIPSGGMVPTLQVRDHVFADKLAYRSRPPRRGDVVVFRRDAFYFVSRVVGISGDKVEFRDGALLLNGVPVPRRAHPGPCSYLDEELAEGPVRIERECRAFVETLDGRDHDLVQDPKAEPHDFEPVTVPPGHFYAVGDNRDNSHDSRFYGSVPNANLVGRVWRVWWRRPRD